MNLITRENIKNNLRKSPMTIMLVVLGIFFGLIFLYKMIMGHFISQYMAQAAEQPVTVSEMKVEYQEWQPNIKASGSTRAVLGVDVTTEVAGLVRTIYFIPGAEVEAKELLVELSSNTEQAQLAALEATLDLAQITYDRDKKLYSSASVSKSTVDRDVADLKNSKAQVEQQKAIIAKKSIRAPFAGRLGISLVNPGQYLNPGDKVVTLQYLDTIYVDFFVPQQYMKKVELGRMVELTTDVYPGKKFTGKITTISPKVDPKTRNIEIEATLDNPEHALLPGMFGNVAVNIEQPKKYLTLPQSAITYNPYGDIVYLIKEDAKIKKGKTLLVVQQAFVEVGETRGNQVMIISGLNAGDRVVTSGQMKLKNGSVVTINNQLAPAFSQNPVVQDEQ